MAADARRASASGLKRRDRCVFEPIVLPLLGFCLTTFGPPQRSPRPPDRTPEARPGVSSAERPCAALFAVQ